MNRVRAWTPSASLLPPPSIDRPDEWPLLRDVDGIPGYARGHPLLVIVEGILDIAFLTRLASRLRPDDPLIPDLTTEMRTGRLVMLPVGGGDLANWTHRLAPFGCTEFHFYDRETAPETERRWAAITTINSRPGCYAVLTRKRSLENYLHPTAVAAVTGIDILIKDDVDVVAAVLAAQNGPPHSLASHGRQHRRRWASRWKRLLNTRAVEQMTPALLAERDPVHEIVQWLRQVGQHLPRRACRP